MSDVSKLISENQYYYERLKNYTCYPDYFNDTIEKVIVILLIYRMF